MAGRRPTPIILGGAALVLAVLIAAVWYLQPVAWSDTEKQAMAALWIGSLADVPVDPTNRVAADPCAQALGHALFFDPRLSGNGAISCATCHQPNLRFTDQLPVSRAIGTSKRNAPSLIGVAYSPWLYWDGRRDSLWAQALSPLEDAAEHGGNRMQYAHLVTTDPHYAVSYEALFGAPPDLSDSARFPSAAGPVNNPEWRAAWQNMAELDRDIVNRVFSNMGKAIAAYERLLQPGPSRFDRYVAAVLADELASADDLLSQRELKGLQLFINEGNCTQCHNGPLFTNNAFHNTGILNRANALPDKGRSVGLRKLQADPFNCLGAFSDDSSDCAELIYAKSGADTIGAVRTPSLRNLTLTQPYGHAGQHAQLRDVLQHYDVAPDALIGHNEAKPLDLWPWQIDTLEAFLLTLDAPPSTAAKWLEPPLPQIRGGTQCTE
jgi:cytochrome c peroxidase